MASDTTPKQCQNIANTYNNGKSSQNPAVSTVLTSNQFAAFESSTYNNGGPVFSDTEMTDTDSADWSKVTHSKKRYRISTGGESQTLGIPEYDALNIDCKLTAIYSQMSINNNKMAVFDKKVDQCLNLHNRVGKLERTVSTQDQRLKLLEYKSIDIEAHGRRNNLIFDGFDESRDKNCFDIITTFINEKLDLHFRLVIDRAHRLGKYKRGSNRAIIVAFKDFTTVQNILSKAYMLKNTPFNINRDFPQEITNARKSIWGEYKDRKQQCPDDKISIVYPAKIIHSGRVVRDVFPDWSEIMRGNRVNIPTTHQTARVNFNGNTARINRARSTSVQRDGNTTQTQSINHTSQSPSTRDEEPRSRRQSKSPQQQRTPRFRAPERNQARDRSATVTRQPRNNGSTHQTYTGGQNNSNGQN